MVDVRYISLTCFVHVMPYFVNMKGRNSRGRPRERLWAPTGTPVSAWNCGRPTRVPSGAHGRSRGRLLLQVTIKTNLLAELKHQAPNEISNSSDRELPRDMFRFKTVWSYLG